MVTIAVVALVVFGPKRLPEIARRAGRVLRDVRAAAQDLKSGIESEYQDALGPLEEARREVRTALDDLSRPADAAQPPSQAADAAAEEPDSPGPEADEVTEPEESA
jgi:sec-independent protein translocase protein TatB